MTRRGLVAAALVVASIACTQSPQPAANSSASPSSSETVSAEQTAPPTPRTTPPGTPAPTPDAPTADSAPVDVSSIPPEPAATPSPQPGLWRIQGFVVDDDGHPLSGVCVVIGPLGCKPFSPHTDDRGHWFIDIAAAKDTTFDFYFEMPGHKTVWWHATPTEPTEFNVVLHNG